MASQLKEAVKWLEQQSYFRKTKVSDQFIWVNKHKNVKGQFMEIYKNTNGQGENIVIPSGVRGKKWAEFAGFIELILNGGLKERRKKNNSSAEQRRGFVRKVGTVSNQHLSNSFGAKQSKSALIAKSYAEILKKNCSRSVLQSNRIVQSRVAEKEEREPVFNEEMAFVCVREKVEDAWKNIEVAINDLFKCRIQLKPFQADRAFFTCRNDKEVSIFRNRNFDFLRNALAVRFNSWEEDEGSKCRMITFTGGWVSVAGLPVSMWNRSNFEKIAEYCGG